jgi:phytoene/squalene synthetase
MVTSRATLARSITRNASRQTDLTISLLVDRRRVEDAYRAYGYFRWVDDRLDQSSISSAERRAFLAAQSNLIEAAYRGEARAAAPEEQMLLDLVRGEPRRECGLGLYIRHMLAVMAFDVERRGHLISQAQLDAYTRSLAIAVTEALHHFIGHGGRSPRGPARYQAVTGAHLAHMLRDYHEDLSLGYINVPREVLGDPPGDPSHIDDVALREWARARVERARRSLRIGRASLKEVESSRCRIGMLAYTLRFESVLRQIERADFVLHPGLGANRPIDAWTSLAQAVLTFAWPGAFAAHSSPNASQAAPPPAEPGTR